MVGSERAASAANAGRGNSFYAVPKDYRIILPQIPSGEEMNRTVVLHCDTKGRPYRIEDFRQPLMDLGVIQEVGGIGAFQMSHVWLVKFRTDDAKKKIVDAGHLDVKRRVCLVVDPNRQEIRVKLHWVSFDVTNDTIRRLFGTYGEVKDVTSERWRVEDCENADSTTRFVRLVLREGVTLDCLPHQLRLGKGTALVVVPGRAPMCLRCNTAGHIRRECRVPKCGECHGFGHEQVECTRSYAGAARRGTDDGHTDLVMDEEEAENAASAFSNEVKEDADVKATTQSVVSEVAETDAKELPADATSTGDNASSETQQEPTANATQDSKTENMEHQEGSLKRRREQTTDMTDEQRLRHLEQKWKVVVGKKRNVNKQRSSSLSRDGK
ncbi:uncharacterized protein LOC144153972 [Haemaphysalis longicornis]